MNGYCPLDLETVNLNERIVIWIIIGIIALTGGGHSTFFLNPELKKNVKTYVLEKERRKEIFSIMKESKKKQKEFVKKRKAYLKAAKKIKH